MKIIFNLTLSHYLKQIYDELIKNYDVILPDNYKDRSNKNIGVDLIALENCVKQNPDAEFIFGFLGKMDLLIKWLNRNLNVPLVLYTVNAIGRVNRAKKSLFTYVWYVEKGAKPLMEKYNLDNLIYQGQAANPYIFYPINIEKIYDVGFFGRHYAGRKYWLTFLEEYCKKKNLKFYFPEGHLRELPWTYKEINQFHNQTKINLSFAPKSRSLRIVNLRTFEICMSGNFQLMQYTPSIEEFFEIDKEIVCWKNKKELVEKILYYLENENEREKIAEKGYKRAIENHTWSKRFEKIREILNRKTQSNISSFIIDKKKLIERKEFNEIQLEDLSKDNLSKITLILQKLGYKLNYDFVDKKSFKLCCPKFLYKPNLKNYLFIKVHHKIMMVIKVISLNKHFKLHNWEHLVKIVGLTENIDLSIPQFKMVNNTKNIDLSLPQFGVLTNGNEWIVRDFKNRKWLMTIPNRRALKANMDLKNYLIFKIKYIIYRNLKFFKFLMIFPQKIRVLAYQSIFNIFFLKKASKNIFQLE